MMDIDVNEAEYVIVSHGHYDHGGGISTYISLNKHAPIILEPRAFTDYYSIKNGKTKYIGLNKDLQNYNRLYDIDTFFKRLVQLHGENAFLPYTVMPL